MRRIASALLLVLVLLAAALWGALRASLPQETGTVSLPALSAPAELRYDAWQRPYVSADSFTDAVAVEGWLHASHRLWQMELHRRAGGGRMAAMLGADLLETDAQLWRFGVPQLAQRLAANASPRLMEVIDAYVQGVNAAIEAYTLPPPEFLLLAQRVEPWTAADVFAVAALTAFQSSNNAQKEILRLALADQLGETRAALFLEDLSERADFPFVLPDASNSLENNRLETAALESDRPASKTIDTGKIPGHRAAVSGSMWRSALEAMDLVNPLRQPLMPRLAFGSNGWVVAPGKSATGNALFAFDSHDALGLPNLFYEVHLFFRSQQDHRELRGWSVPGLPGVINGFNESIAWGFTNIGDSQDLLIETPVPDKPGWFRDGERRYAARAENVILAVRGGEPVPLKILHTANGRLIHEDPPLTLHWSAGHLGSRGLDALLDFNLARNWDEFNAALDQHVAPVLNATYADVEGNIGFRTTGLLPQRARGEGLLPLPATPENRWLGLVTAADMPRLLNPDAGFIAAANARVNTRGSYPLVSADNAAPYRIARLQSVLREQRLFTTDDMRKLQRDWHDGQAALLLPALLRALPENPALTAERKLLSNWLTAPVASPDSAAALLFQTWYLELSDALFAPALGEALYQRLLAESYLLNFALDTLILTDRHADWWPATRAEVLMKSLAKASARLQARHGNIRQWRLDSEQSVGLQHELSRAVPALAPLLSVAPVPWGGSPATVGRANYSYRRPFQVVHGATVRVVAELRRPPSVQAVIPGGQSGHPLSAHYRDQFDRWRRGELEAIWSIPKSPPDIMLSP